MEQKLEIIPEGKIKEVKQRGRCVLQLSFPNTEYNPIYVSYVKKPTTDELSVFVRSLGYNVDEFRIVG